MAIATEVAKVSGAVRCTPRGRDLGDNPIVTRETSLFTIPELLADTRAYVRRERERILEVLRFKRGRR